MKLLELKDFSNLKNYFEIYNGKSNIIYEESIKEVHSWAEDIINEFQSVTSKSPLEYLKSLLSGILDFLFNFILYFCNIGVNIILILYIFLHETFAGTQEEYAKLIGCTKE